MNNTIGEWILVDVEILLRGFVERNFFIFLFLDEKEVSWKSVGKYGWEFIKNCVTGIFGLLESGFGYNK